MSVENKTDKATARPVGEAVTDKHGDHHQHIQFGEMAFTVTTPPGWTREGTESLCRSIAAAVNEHEALCAVADAAEIQMLAAHNLKTACERFGDGGAFVKMLGDKNKMLWQAVSALSAIRNGGAK